MAISQPISTDKLNSPDHSLMHRQIATDPSAPVQSLIISAAGNLGGTCLQNTNPTNLLSNGDFENWSAGASTAPDGWSSSSSDADRGREASTVKLGIYSFKIVSNNNTDTTYYYQAIHTPKGITYWKGRTVTFSCWVWTDTANKARLRIEDGAAHYTYSSYHTGDSTWQLLTVTETVESDATGIYCELFLDQAPTYTAYFDGAMCVEGESVFAFADKPAGLLEWRAWTSTLVWATAAPTLGTAISRFSIVGKTCHFSIYIPFTDGNNSTGLTSATLPIAPADNNNYIACSVVYLVDATYTIGGAVIDALTPAGILGRVAPTLTDTKAGNVVISGSYEIA